MKNTIPEDNLSYSILLGIDDGVSKGSGFRMKYADKNYIITAKHVLYKSDGNLWGKKLLVTCQSPERAVTEPTTFEVNLEEAKIYYSKKDDVAAILIGHNEKLYEDETPLKEMTNKNKRPSLLYGETYVKVISKGTGRIVSVDKEATRGLDKIKIANDVYLMGYPTSLGLQRNSYFDYSKPLLRKGIIAGINTKENTFIIDCAAYQGNSGGPIIEECEDDFFRVIGLVSKYIPYETKWFSNRDQITNIELSNSGYSVCVPMNAVFDVLDNIKD